MKKIKISCDDACKSDLKLNKLCKKYDTVLILYWPADMTAVARQNNFQPLTPQEANILAKDNEIGSHTITHRWLTKIPVDEACDEIEQSKYMLENMFFTKITKFAPPRGYTNDLLTKFTMKFYEKQRLTKGKGLVHIHPNSGANKYKDWRQAVNKNTEELWCHSWELDKYNLWGELEEFLRERS